MQLILDAENIDIERNMSTIEHELLNEKFLANKVIGHLADDITSGNKENIQKQENIIQDVEETNIVDTDKETQSGGEDILTNNTNVDTIDTEGVQTSEKIIHERSTEKTPEQVPDAVVIENISNEEFLPKSNEAKLEDTNNEDVNEKDLIEENKNDLISLYNNPTVGVFATVLENNSIEVSNKRNENEDVPLDHEIDISELSEELNKEKTLILDKEVHIDVVVTALKEEQEMDFDKEDDIAEVSTELNEEKEIDLDKEDDIPEISTELNEENEMDLDKDNDISEVSTELNEENEMDLDKDNDISEVSTELNEENEIYLDKENYISEVSTELNEENEIDFDKEDDFVENPTELYEGKEIDLDEEDDFAEDSTELYEEKEMDLNKKDDFAEVSTELNNDNDIEVDAEKATERDLEKDSVQNEVPNINLNDDSQEGDCSVIEPTTHETNEKNNAESHGNMDEVREIVDKNKAELSEKIDSRKNTAVNKALEEPVHSKRICRLSNNLEIFSDEEENDQSDDRFPNDNIQPMTEKQCINIDDDDDIMLIDEDLGAKDSNKEAMALEVENPNFVSNRIHSVPKNTQNDLNPSIKTKQVSDIVVETSPSITENKGPVSSDVLISETDKTAAVKPDGKEKTKKPLLQKNFLDTWKIDLSEMTRNDLEEFCVLKIVESIIDRGNLAEIKANLKNLNQTVEECKKKCFMLTKQNKDLQIVLKSVRDEQRIGTDVHITPLKITRSVGMQVVMLDKHRRKTVNGVAPQTPVPTSNTKVKNQQAPSTRNQKEKVPGSQQIPVPRLVPAPPTQAKTNPSPTNTATKPVNNTVVPNGMRNSPPAQKVDKRPRSQAITVDLTDDEPPAKLQNVQRGPVAQAMRVITAGTNLVPAPRFAQNINSPRKVYIPISGPQAQGVRPGPTIMLKTLPGLGPRPNSAAATLMPKGQTTNSMRFARGQLFRHPAALPNAMKQYQPPNWKCLPPAPDLKLSKVENGIVISWRIDSYDEEDHEEIASYQLYAYQETNSPPNTALWKKIGDVKALPLPMACTLTQFMAGYKYYFAVRAVDIRSRYGPFSLPGSILLLNKM